MRSFLIIISLIIIGIQPLLASNKQVAKAILLRGNVEMSLDGKVSKLKKGMSVDEGAILKTKAKSFVKLIFLDKSQISVGPNSEMKITAFPTKKAGIISLLKGKIRSKVSKDYMKIQDKNKSKLFIKTKTAAMGVRGTDFQVNYNPKNNKTALVTFHGAVAMAKISGLRKINQKSLEKAVSSPRAVMVRKGQYSGVSPKTKGASVPVKINPSQLDSLKDNSIPGIKTSNKKINFKEDKKVVRDIVPPGLKSESFVSSAQQIDSSLNSSLGKDTISTVKKSENQVKKDPSDTKKHVAPQAAPRAGGFVDIETAQYIEPPKDSQYDSRTETFVPPQSIGSFDTETGDYRPKDYKLTLDGKLIPKTASGRLPASVSANSKTNSSNQLNNFARRELDRVQQRQSDLVNGPRAGLSDRTTVNINICNGTCP